MGRIVASPHPKKGMRSSSRLRTQTCGANQRWSASVSHADSCLERMTVGSAGMFSSPATSDFTPHVSESQNRLKRLHRVTILHRNR